MWNDFSFRNFVLLVCKNDTTVNQSIHSTLSWLLVLSNIRINPRTQILIFVAPDCISPGPGFVLRPFENRARPLTVSLLVKSNIPHRMRRTSECRTKSVHPDLQVSIQLDNPKKCFTTGDAIHGQVTLRAASNLDFQDMCIEFIGTSRTLVERWSATPGGCMPCTSTAHNFLRLSQPGLQRSFPPNQTFLAGEDYHFDFTFVIPDRLPEGLCRHPALDQAVRNAHAQLPPSLGRSQYTGKDGRCDDLSHDKGSISYGIFVTVTEQDEYHESRTLAYQSRGLRVIPSLSGCSNEELRHLLIDRQHSKYRTRHEELVKGGGLIKRKQLGTLVAEATLPKSIHMPDLSCRSSTATGTMVSANLVFKPASESSQDVPQLERVSTKLRVRTDIASKPCREFPQDSDVLFDASRLRRNETLTLSELALSGVQWRPTTTSNKRNQTSSSSKDTVFEASPPYENPASIFETCLTIPITLPENDSIALVPAFHSCYISRTYALDIDISYSTAGVRGSISLCLPLQVTTGTPTKSSELLISYEDLMSSNLPEYEDRDR